MISARHIMFMMWWIGMDCFLSFALADHSDFVRTFLDDEYMVGHGVNHK